MPSIYAEKMRQHGIIAYGEKEDRERLKAVAAAENRSGSEWLIARIRERYAEVFGDLEPRVACSGG
jgi:hypothetical protein